MIARFLLAIFMVAPICSLAQPADKKQALREALNPYYSKGIELFNAGRAEEAAEYFTRSIDSNEFLAYRSRFGRGVYYVRTHRWPEARTDLDVSLSVESDDPVALVMRGLALANMDSLNDALADANQVLEMDSSKPDVRQMRGMAHSVRGKVFIAQNSSRDVICAELALARSMGDPAGTALYEAHCSTQIETMQFDWLKSWKVELVEDLPGMRHYMAFKNGESTDNWTEAADLFELEDALEMSGYDERFDVSVDALLDGFTKLRLAEFPNLKINIIERDPAVPSRWIIAKADVGMPISALWYISRGTSTAFMVERLIKQASISKQTVKSWVDAFKRGKIVSAPRSPSSK
jgi:tetratricopeptide (TPR) repeat protein